MFDSLIRFVRDQYRTDEFIPLHAPVFRGREREWLAAGSLWDATQAGTRAANTLKANPAKATPRKTATS
jgi:hypothetical protein